MLLRKILDWLFPFDDSPTDTLPMGYPDYKSLSVDRVVRNCLKFNGFDEKGNLIRNFYPTKVEILNYQNSFKKIGCNKKNFTERNIVEMFLESKKSKPNLTPREFANFFEMNLWTTI